MFYLYYYKLNKNGLDGLKKSWAPKPKDISKELWNVIIGLSVLNILAIIFLIIYFCIPDAM